MVTVSILGTDLHPKDKYLSLSKSESKPMEKSCIVQESESESESESGIGDKP